MKHKLYPNDLKRVISAIILLAIKDLNSYSFACLGPKCSVQTARTAWLFIFDNNYRMIFGNTNLSLQDMLGIICNIQDKSIVSGLRAIVKTKINEPI